MRENAEEHAEKCDLCKDKEPCAIYDQKIINDEKLKELEPKMEIPELWKHLLSQGAFTNSPEIEQGLENNGKQRLCIHHIMDGTHDAALVVFNQNHAEDPWNCTLCHYERSELEALEFTERILGVVYFALENNIDSQLTLEYISRKIGKEASNVAIEANDESEDCVKLEKFVHKAQKLKESMLDNLDGE